MKVVYIERFNKFNLANLTLALGYFDGMHIAHKKLLDKTLEVANNTNTKSAMLTFDENIHDFISNKKSKHITSFQDKIDIAMSLGFDYIIQVELTSDFISLTQDEFIDIFIKNQANVVCGFDYTFGYLGLGNVDSLKKAFKNVYIIDCLMIDNNKIGSSYIKNLLLNGEIKNANNLLGRPYKISGTLSKRNKFYSLPINNYCLIKSGIYECRIKSYSHDLIMNLKIKKDEDNNLLIIKKEIPELEEIVKSQSISIDLFVLNEINI